MPSSFKTTQLARWLAGDGTIDHCQCYCESCHCLLAPRLYSLAFLKTISEILTTCPRRSFCVTRDRRPGQPMVRLGVLCVLLGLAVVAPARELQEQHSGSPCSHLRAGSVVAIDHSAGGHAQLQLGFSDNPHAEGEAWWCGWCGGASHCYVASGSMAPALTSPLSPLRLPTGRQAP